MVRPAFLIAADANLPWQVKPAGRREPQPRVCGVSRSHIRTKPANEAGLPPSVRRAPPPDVLVASQPQRNYAVRGDGEGAIQRLSFF